MKNDGQKFKHPQQLVFFVDFSGWSYALGQHDQLEGLTELLHDMKEAVGNFDIYRTPFPNGERAIVARPAVSTFSDLVVMSFNIEELGSPDHDGVKHFDYLTKMISRAGSGDDRRKWFDAVCKLAKKNIAAFEE